LELYNIFSCFSSLGLTNDGDRAYYGNSSTRVEFAQWAHPAFGGLKTKIEIFVPKPLIFGGKDKIFVKYNGRRN